MASAQELKETIDTSIEDIKGLLNVIQSKEELDDYDKGFKAALERCLSMLIMEN